MGDCQRILKLMHRQEESYRVGSTGDTNQHTLASREHEMLRDGCRDSVGEAVHVVWKDYVTEE